MLIGTGAAAVSASKEPIRTNASDVTYTFSDNYSANTVLDGTAISLDSYTTITFNKRSGGTPTQYKGTAVKWHGGGTAAFSSFKTLIGIEINFKHTANTISADVGSYASGVWTGSASSITLSQSGPGGYCCISSISLTYQPVHVHSFGEWEITTPATCTEAGEKTRTCECGATETEVIPATGHHYEDGVCVDCGAEEPVYFVILPSDGEAAASTDFSFTKLPFTVSVTASTLGDEIRVFEGQSITISGVTMKKIVFTCTTNGTTEYGPGSWGDGAPSGYTFESDGKTGTWEGKLDSITFTATDNQVRITEIDIYIDAKGYADMFMDNLLCNAAGTSEPTYNTGYSWSVYKDIYRTLDSAEKAKFLTSNSDTADMVARYDYVVGKYNYEDFIGRDPVSLGLNRNILNTATETPIAAIICIAIVSITTVGIIITLKKRKVN